MLSFYTSSGRLALSLIVALLLVYSVCVHGHRSCGLGKFCRIGVDCSNGCVETCPTSTDRHVQGNWTTGSCEPVPDEVQYWMDSTLYEIFISPTVTGEFKNLGFIISEEFQRHDDNGDDITFHLYPSDNPYFHFGNNDSIHVAFNNFYVPNVIETCSLSSATSDPIPLDDYELQVAVSIRGIELLRRDIIIHVVEPLSSLPPPVTTVEFSSSTLSVWESSGSLVVPLVLSGQTQSQSFSVIVIAEANSSLSPAAAAGMDFTPGRYTATFTMGATTTTASIPIVADGIDEPTEQFSLRLYIDGAGYGMGLQQGANKAAIVNILLSEDFKSSYGDRYVHPNRGQNDGKYIYPYVLQKTLMRRATVYNEPDYVSEQKIMEFRKERTRHASLEVIFDKSVYRINERDGQVQPALTLSNSSSTNITVQVRDNANAATGGGIDYESGPYTVTFTAGQTSTSFSVPISNDNILENDEDFTLTIVLSTLPDGVTHGARTVTTVIIVDDDAITISFNQSTYSVDEDAGTAQLVLVLSNPSSTDFIVQVSDTQNTATRGVDYGFGPYITTFFAGETIASFGILINDNSIFETNKAFSLTIDPNLLPTDVTGGSHGIATVTIVDDDAITVSFNQSTFNFSEDIGLARPLLVLSDSSSTDITVKVRDNQNTATRGGVDYDSGPYTVTFPAGQTRASFNVSINDDDICESNEDFTLVIRRNSLPNGVIRDEPATVTIVDDDVITITCPPLGDAPRNGDIGCSLGDNGEVKPGDSCTYTCDDGFGLQEGSTTRTCQNDGTWSGTEPRCIRACNLLTAPENGMIDCSLGGDGNANPGDTCTFTCDDGFTLCGSAMRECQYQHRRGTSWSGNEVRCVPGRVCPPLMAPDNGTIGCSLGDDGTATNGDTCTVTCNDGFTLHGDATRTCQITRRRIRWLGDKARCVQVRVCPPLMAPDNGIVNCSLEDDGAATNGDTCTVTCNDGFTLHGDTARTCQITRRRIRWLGDEARCVQDMHKDIF